VQSATVAARSIRMRRWSQLSTQFSNRTILAVSLLLCVVLAIGGAYLLGLLDLAGLLP
jgi:hypothetical protein